MLEAQSEIVSRGWEKKEGGGGGLFAKAITAISRKRRGPAISIRDF
jgi:hypothetical protein